MRGVTFAAVARVMTPALRRHPDPLVANISLHEDRQ